MLKFFAEKMWVAFAYNAKATHIFSAKNFRILYIESAKTVNKITLNELVKLTMLWTTGPCYLYEFYSCNLYRCVQIIITTFIYRVAISMTNKVAFFQWQKSTKTSSKNDILPPLLQYPKESCPSELCVRIAISSNDLWNYRLNLLFDTQT